MHNWKIDKTICAAGRSGQDEVRFVPVTNEVARKGDGADSARSHLYGKWIKWFGIRSRRYIGDAAYSSLNLFRIPMPYLFLALFHTIFHILSGTFCCCGINRSGLRFGGVCLVSFVDASFFMASSFNCFKANFMSLNCLLLWSYR
jgi:hypothetical protein